MINLIIILMLCINILTLILYLRQVKNIKYIAGKVQEQISCIEKMNIEATEGLTSIKKSLIPLERTSIDVIVRDMLTRGNIHER